ncbi:purple acid phosphatase 4-like [Miscanthus floridulus]|uniref:purple acid phosphatase 4-like n=1 Tax=Miscanthus floridulus TaxID=154761 RepID=UPI003458F736
MAQRKAAMAAAAFFALLAVASLLCAPAAAELVRLEHPAKNDGSLSLLVVGDWGRKGTYNQSRVAQQMGKVGEQLNIDFVISTGDNFYENGLTGTDDQAFEQSFTDIYTAKSLQKPWYLVLGNHDYRGDALAQLSPVLKKIDSRFICMKSFIVNAEIVNFFFVDTTPFQLKYWTHPKDDHYDWRGVAPREKYINNLLKDLDEAMKKSTAAWKIAVGHHTMRSVSDHGDTKELLQLLLPVLQANGVDFYINGHDHCLEHISSRDSPIQYFTSGGGSKAWRGVQNTNEDDLKFFYDGQGFMSLQLDHSEAHFTFYDVDGKELYHYARPSLRKTADHLQASGYVNEE